MKNKILRYSFGVLIGVISFFILLICSINLYFFVNEKPINNNEKDIVLTLSGIIETGINEENKDKAEPIKDNTQKEESPEIDNPDDEQMKDEFKIEIEPISKLFFEKTFIIAGDKLNIEYNIKNIKNVAANVNEKMTIVITDKNNNPIELNSKNPELQLYFYNDIEENEKGYTIKENAQPLGTLKNNIIEYNFQNYNLNGIGENAQTIDNKISNFKNTKMVLVFDKKAGNDFQNINININTDVNATQYFK